MSIAHIPTKLASPFVLVTGGKGGVGKTTVCANLGVQLASEGKRVLLVDLDFGLANLGIFLGLSQKATVEEALAGRARLKDCVLEGPGGVSLLAASSGSEAMGRLEQADYDRLFGSLVEVSKDYDLVLGDSAAGIGSSVLHFSSLADRVLVVTTPEVCALTDAYGLIKALDEYGARGGLDIPTPEVIVNLSCGVEKGQAVARKLRSVCERFLARSPRQAGWIPRSSGVASSTERRNPFALGSKKTLEHLCLRQISARLGRMCASTGPEGADLGMLLQGSNEHAR